jgi:hypothetical protein
MSEQPSEESSQDDADERSRLDHAVEFVLDVGELITDLF